TWWETNKFDFIDLHRVTVWPESWRRAMGDIRSALFGSFSSDEANWYVLLLKPGRAGYDNTTLELFKRHLAVLKQAIAQFSSAERQAEMERDLREAQKLEAVGQLAGGIAHEINTPAQYIGDNLRFLSESQQDLITLLDQALTLVASLPALPDLAEPISALNALVEDLDLAYLRDEVPDATRQSQEGIAQISRIVLAMKEFSHPGSLDRSYADLNRGLENTVTISRNEWKHVAEVKLDLEDGLPTIPCRIGELNQAFLNLVVNAAHAIADKQRRPGAQPNAELGKITIRSARQGDMAVIQIQDTGSGIPERIRNRIFEPFFTTKEVGQGTGQGLSITRDIIVKKHGGAISFTSEVGKGSVFTVQLPLAPPGEPTPPEPTPPDPTPNAPTANTPEAGS
ncbi:MAG: sensor histidine kinase, partial [Rhodospirillaceae bacterium]